MTILVDANLTPFWVEYLQSAGIEAVHWWSVGKGDAPDVELLEWAVEHDAAILTGDGDFSQLLALRRLSRPSVIYLRTGEQNPQGPGSPGHCGVQRDCRARGEWVYRHNRRPRQPITSLADPERRVAT